MHLKYYTSLFFLVLYINIYKRSPRHISANNIYNEQNFGAQGAFDEPIWIYRTYQASFNTGFIPYIIKIF